MWSNLSTSKSHAYIIADNYKKGTNFNLDFKRQAKSGEDIGERIKSQLAHGLIGLPNKV